VNSTRVVLMSMAALSLLGGCALFSGDEDFGHKNSGIRFVEPDSPYKRIDVTSADRVWQSTRTGNTIAVNSVCKTSEDRSLKALEQSILSGVENLKVNSTGNLTVDEAKADRIGAEGKTDGVPIDIDLIEFRKGECTYDLAYVGRKKDFSSEQKIFNRFLEGFHAP